MGYFLLLLLVAKSIADCCIICLGSSSLKKDLNSSSFHWCYSQSLQNSFRAKSPRPSKEIKRQTEHLLLSPCETTWLFLGWYQAINALEAVFTQENAWKMHVRGSSPPPPSTGRFQAGEEQHGCPSPARWRVICRQPNSTLDWAVLQLRELKQLVCCLLMRWRAPRCKTAGVTPHSWPSVPLREKQNPQVPAPPGNPATGLQAGWRTMQTTIFLGIWKHGCRFIDFLGIWKHNCLSWSSPWTFCGAWYGHRPCSGHGELETSCRPHHGSKSWSSILNLPFMVIKKNIIYIKNSCLYSIHTFHSIHNSSG